MNDIFGDDSDSKHTSWHSIHAILIIKFYNFKAKFRWQSHFVGMFDIRIGESLFPPLFLFVFYAEYLVKGFLPIVLFGWIIQISFVQLDTGFFGRTVLIMHNAFVYFGTCNSLKSFHLSWRFCNRKNGRWYFSLCTSNLNLERHFVTVHRILNSE